MKREAILTTLGLLALSMVAGCALKSPRSIFDPNQSHYDSLADGAEFPDVKESIAEDLTATAPLTIHESQREPWPLTPEDAVQMALANSPVLRDLGGLVLQAPNNARTILGPSIQQTDPRFGIDGALSAFDAQFLGRASGEKNNYVSNNRFLGGGANIIQQDLDVFSAQISKKAATGTEFFIRHNVDYNANNSPGNLFPSAWNVNIESEFRHPLMQGGGTDFNRIAGPNATPGVYNGIMVARVNSDISIVDFELGIRDLVNNVENAYWDLYFAYRDLEARVAARDAALTTWRQIQALGELPGGVADREAQAREQYFRFQEEVQNALTGRVLDGTRSNNGSSGGTFRGTIGVQLCERRLRLLMGIAINDGKTIVPAHEPVIAPVVFDWGQITADALVRRPELRRQQLQVKRRELELIASRNFLLPRLDITGRYRWRGFGHGLIDPDPTGLPDFDNAYMNLTSGDFQEWRLGAELAFPFGFRQAHAAQRNAQLQLARDRAVLMEQERQVVHDLSNAIGDMNRTYEICRTAFNRRIAAKKQLAVLQERERLGSKVDLNTMLDAQRRAADADSRYFGAMVEYVLSVKNVHLEKGTLLEYNNVILTERAWPTMSSARRSPDPHVLPSYQIDQPPRSAPASHAANPSIAPVRVEPNESEGPLPEPTNVSAVGEEIGVNSQAILPLRLPIETSEGPLPPILRAPPVENPVESPTGVPVEMPAQTPNTERLPPPPPAMERMPDPSLELPTNERSEIAPVSYETRRALPKRVSPTIKR